MHIYAQMFNLRVETLQLAELYRVSRIRKHSCNALVQNQPQLSFLDALHGMADLPDFLDITCSEEPPGPTTEVSLVAADVDMQRQDRAKTQLRPAVNKRPARRVARYPGPKKT